MSSPKRNRITVTVPMRNKTLRDILLRSVILVLWILFPFLKLLIVASNLFLFALALALFFCPAINRGIDNLEIPKLLALLIVSAAIAFFVYLFKRIKDLFSWLSRISPQYFRFDFSKVSNLNLSLRGTTSLFLAGSFTISLISGLVLFIKLSSASGNDIIAAGLERKQWLKLHLTFSFSTLLAIIIHLYFNYKTLLSYLKNKNDKLLSKIGNILLAIGLIFLLILVVL